MVTFFLLFFIASIDIRETMKMNLIIVHCSSNLDIWSEIKPEMHPFLVLPLMQDLVTDLASSIQEDAETSVWGVRTKREHWLLELWTSNEERTLKMVTRSVLRYIWSPVSGTSGWVQLCSRNRQGEGGWVRSGHPSEWSKISRCFSRYPLSLRSVQSDSPVTGSLFTSHQRVGMMVTDTELWTYLGLDYYD